MLTQCPHCQQRLPFTVEQQNRLQQALNQLAPGKSLTIKCPLCQKTIMMDQAGKAAGAALTRPAPVSTLAIEPPAPPNLDWLRSSTQEDYANINDIPMVLLLHEENKQREEISETLKSAGYQCLPLADFNEAIERMRFIDFSCVIFQVGLDGPLEQSAFHGFMRRMSMDRRRYIFYVLIGAQFNTLYLLEALSLSANLTINTEDLPYLDAVLRRGLQGYEELFGPFVEELRALGRR